jgi:cytochrome b subunit of formate dehydrogenase
MWTIYFIDVLENIGCIAGIILVVSCIIAFISGMSAVMDDSMRAQHIFKRTTVAIALSALFIIFVPAKKTMYLMVGAYAVERVVETPEAKEFGSKLLTIVNSKLDEMIEKESKKK